MAKNRMVYLIALLGVTLFYVFFVGYLSYFLFYLTLLLPLFSLGFSLLTLGKIQLSLYGEKSFQPVAQEGTIGLELRIKGLLPPPRMRLKLGLFNELTGQRCRETIDFTPSRGTQTLLHSFSAVHCGPVTATLTGLRTMDFLGLFSLPRRVKQVPSATVVFHPALVPHAMNSPVRGEAQTEEDAYSQDKPGDDPAELFGFRDYREGDRLSKIHWKLSQRLDTLVVKEYGLPLTQSMVLALDLGGDPDEDPSALWNTSPEETAPGDARLEGAFSMALSLIEQNISCSLRYYHKINRCIHRLEISQVPQLFTAMEEVLRCGDGGVSLLESPGILPEPGVSLAYYFGGALPKARAQALREWLPQAKIFAAVAEETPVEAAEEGEITTVHFR